MPAVAVGWARADQLNLAFRQKTANVDNPADPGKASGGPPECVIHWNFRLIVPDDRAITAPTTPIVRYAAQRLGDGLRWATARASAIQCVLASFHRPPMHGPRVLALRLGPSGLEGEAPAEPFFDDSAARGASPTRYTNLKTRSGAAVAVGEDVAAAFLDGADSVA